MGHQVDMMTYKWYTCVMKKLRAAIRRMLGVPSQEEIQQLALDLERKLNARVAVAESQIRARSKELEKAETEMQKVATDLTLALYDAVEKIMAEIAEAKRTLEKEKE